MDNGYGDLVLTSEQLREKSTEEVQIPVPAARPPLKAASDLPLAWMAPSCFSSQLVALLPRLRVVARALPSDKSRLVQIGQMCSKCCLLSLPLLAASRCALAQIPFLVSDLAVVLITWHTLRARRPAQLR